MESSSFLTTKSIRAFHNLLRILIQMVDAFMAVRPLPDMFN